MKMTMMPLLMYGSEALAAKKGAEVNDPSSQSQNEKVATSGVGVVCVWMCVV